MRRMTDYLVKIFKGKIPSERHEQFHKGVSQQNKLQYNSLGPIDDDEQLEKITEHLGGWLAEVTDQLFPNSNYLFGVWLPEAIVKAIVKVRRCSRQRAWEVFSQGVRLVKCERLEIHNSMIQKT
nr:hypothetical protein BaRGS_026710 [Batillaria attramentaria]